MLSTTIESDEISLLEEELVQLSVKSSRIVLDRIPSLLCTIWTKKSFNLDSFRAQMKSVWKTTKKIDIQVVGVNLFLIKFNYEEDLEVVMERRPWLFCRYLIIFDRLENLLIETKLNWSILLSGWNWDHVLRNVTKRT